MEQPVSNALVRLSHFTKALIDNLKKIKAKPPPDENSKISVSQTVSFFAIAYEKVRNAVEYREAHLIRRAAIERILKRRLSLNTEATAESENILRELLWARYFPNESLGTNDTQEVQRVLDKYMLIRKQLLVGQTDKNKNYYSQFLLDLLTCEIEEALSPLQSKRSSLFSFFIYQVLKDKVKIEDISEEQKNAYFYVALEKSFNKSDIPYLRYHLFTLTGDKISAALFRKIDDLIANPNPERLRRFVRNQMPPFHILFELFKKHASKTEAILQDKSKLWTEVEQLCREKYEQTKKRLSNLAVKAVIYIFITKMLFVLILEHPLSIILYNEVNYFALAINTIFPPLLMFIIISLTKIPGEDNTKRLYERIVDIVDADKTFEKAVSFITKKRKVRRPILIFGFTIFYTLTFFITFSLLYELLSLLRFNLVSQAVFVFFVSLITFFAYRIRLIAKEYQLQEKESFFRPFIDFFFMPILSLGKFLSSSLAKINIFGAMFDFLIEAPFKLLIEVVEEWISFVRSKREEIA